MAETTSQLITEIQHERHRLGDAVDKLRRSMAHTRYTASRAARVLLYAVPVAVATLTAVVVVSVRALFRWSVRRLRLA